MKPLNLTWEIFHFINFFFFSLFQLFSVFLKGNKTVFGTKRYLKYKGLFLFSVTEKNKKQTFKQVIVDHKANFKIFLYRQKTILHSYYLMFLVLIKQRPTLIFNNLSHE